MLVYQRVTVTSRSFVVSTIRQAETDGKQTPPPGLTEPTVTGKRGKMVLLRHEDSHLVAHLGLIMGIFEWK